VQVSGPGEGNGRGEEPREGSSVLSNLPRTRPQRASPRRAAARSSAAAAQEPAAANGNGSAPSSAAPRKSAKPAATAGTRPRKAPAKAKAKAKAKAPRRTPEDVPRQGYESVEERATGPVQPPGNAEFLGTAAEIVTELAKAGISGSERLVRDVLTRLGR
jgi:hypothetical protein